jgi:hypothetical protein
MSDTALVQLDRARLALAECKTAMEAKQIADVAEAARVYLERTNASAETVNHATEIRILAERQMGEFLKSRPRTNHAEHGGGRYKVALRPQTDATPQTLPEMGISYEESRRSQQLAAIPAPEFHERIAAAKASGGRLSSNAVIKPAAVKAGEQADAESENLWKLKNLWKKTGKKDRAAFMKWVRIQQEIPNEI